MNTYFAYDGNYGDADGIVILDTYRFTDEDWDLLEVTPDHERGQAAQEIADRYADEERNR
jgi:hypothetical protein